MNVLDFLFPNYTCLICRNEIVAKGEIFGGNLLICDSCAPKLASAENTCKKCGQRVGLHASVCDRCRKEKWHFDKAASAFVYEDDVVDLVLRLKYNAEGDIAKAAAPFMASVVVKNFMNADFIVPVPLTKKRFKSRGYNQAELLADEISIILAAEKSAGEVTPSVEKSVLVRIKQTEKQQDMTAKQRADNLKNAFGITDSGLIKGKTILLVDDVFTTGATTNECSRMLKKAGAEKVYAITIANTELKPVKR